MYHFNNGMASLRRGLVFRVCPFDSSRMQLRYNFNDLMASLGEVYLATSHSAGGWMQLRYYFN